MMLELIFVEGGCVYVKNKCTWVIANLEANEDNGSPFWDSIKNNKSL